jgi:hypothetical protein
VLLPADEQFSELGAPITDVVIGYDVVAQQAKSACQGITENGGTDVADMHRLSHIGGAEINDNGTGLVGLLEKEMSSTGGRVQSFFQSCGFEPEIQEARAGYVDLLTPVFQVEPGDHIASQLTRVHLSRLGQGHQGSGLVISEFWVWTRPHQDRSSVHLRQDGFDGGLKALLNLMVR